jgi:hypothetical protein
MYEQTIEQPESFYETSFEPNAREVVGYGHESHLKCTTVKNLIASCNDVGFGWRGFEFLNFSIAE